jgi:hypothetical protein
MKYTGLIAIAALLSTSQAVTIKSALANSFAPPPMGPYASDTDHLSSECYGGDEDDIMYDVFERYRVEERNPMGAGTGIWKLPKASGPQWASDIVRRFHVMDDDKVDAYVKANFDNFWAKYDNNGTGEIYESEGETFMRALMGPNNRFRLAPGALSDMNNAELIHQNEFSAAADKIPFTHRYDIAAATFANNYNRVDNGDGVASNSTSTADASDAGQ